MLSSVKKKWYAVTDHYKETTSTPYPTPILTHPHPHPLPHPTRPPLRPTHPSHVSGNEIFRSFVHVFSYGFTKTIMSTKVNRKYKIHTTMRPIVFSLRPVKRPYSCQNEWPSSSSSRCFLKKSFSSPGERHQPVKKYKELLQSYTSCAITGNVIADSYRSPRDDVTSHLHAVDNKPQKLTHLRLHHKPKRPKIQPFLHGLDKGISNRIFAQGIPLHV